VKRKPKYLRNVQAAIAYKHKDALAVISTRSPAVIAETVERTTKTFLEDTLPIDEVPMLPTISLN
jgi:hypothetical protein